MRYHLHTLKRAGFALVASLFLVGLLMGALGWADRQPGSLAQGSVARDNMAGPADDISAARSAANGPSETRPPAKALLSAAQKALGGGGPEQAVRRAWQMARDAGTYHFATDLKQSTYPARILSNAGRGPQEQAAHLEGDLDISASTLNLRLWQGGGSVLSEANSLEARIEGSRAYIRSSGGAWKEQEDFSGSFAPGNDLLAYLVAMKNVRQVTATDADVSAGRTSLYAFDVDGPVFARYMRDQLEKQLRESGELPLDLTLDTAAQYRQMAGTGEILIDGRGLPLRLTLHLVYPEQQNGSHVEADIQTDFSGFSPIATTLQRATLTLQRLPSSWGVATGRAGLLACSLALMAVMVTSRRSRRVYGVVVVAVILSMVVTPLLQSQTVSAFFDRQAARQEQQAQEEKANQIAQDYLAGQKSWDPHSNPLEAQAAASPEAAGHQQAQVPGQRVPAIPDSPIAATSTTSPTDSCDQSDTADTDGDGLNNYDECIMGTNPSNPDMDGDGLSDGQEVDRLGTAASIQDTDGDSIPDPVEVRGFSYAGKQWYLDPANPDSNRDGQLDSMECPPLADGTAITPDVIRDQCDADKDNIPDPFDDDNDNDGVPDSVDFSPNDVLDRNAISHSGAALRGDAAYNRANPFQLMVSDLTAGYPSFVDLQFQPVNPKHLTYALNVIDWPAGDDEGQIQHVKDTTFATSDNPDIRQPDDETGQYGDMRLVPLMEIEMTGDSMPLKLVTPAVTVTVRGELSATVSLTQHEANSAYTDLVFHFEDTDSHDVGIFEGGCELLGASLGTFNGVRNGSTGVLTTPRLTTLADAEHVMKFSWGDAKTACTAIPNVINGPYADKMVDTSVLDPYGIGVTEGEEQPEGGKELLVYVPLNLAPDQTNGNRTAFAARMLYWPGADNPWTTAQQVRLLWAVQALTDDCVEPESQHDQAYQKAHPAEYRAALETDCAAPENRTMDHLQIVQEYDEDFYVTGMSVSEDRGLDVAIAYLDPAAYPADDQNLWELSWGLSEMFVPGRNCESDATMTGDSDPNTCHSDAQRDLTIFETDSAGARVGNSSIAGRFDHADRNHNGTPDNVEYAQAKGWSAQRQNDLRWSIPANALDVETMRFPHEDYQAYLSSNVVPRVLKQFSANVNPTLLIATERRYRSAGLAAATLSNGVLVVDNDPQNHKEQTTTSLIWGPYRYNQTLDPVSHKVVGWEPYPTEEYYSKLGDALVKRFDANFPEDVGATNQGKAEVARGFYMTLLAGVTSEVCTSGAECLVEEGESDEELIASAEELADKIAEMAGDLVLDMMKAYRQLQSRALGEWWTAVCTGHGDEWDGWHVKHAVFESIGEAFKDFFLSPWTFLWNNRSFVTMIGLGIVAAGAITTIALSFILGSKVSGAELAARILLSTTVILSVLSLVKAVAKTVKELAHGIGKFLWESASGFKSMLRMNKVSIILRIIVAVAITWGVFIAEWAMGNLGAVGALAWDSAIWGAVASTVVTILIFVILTALGPLGELIWAVIGLIDSLVALICNAFLTKEQQESWYANFFCGGITGMVANIIEWFFYSGTIMVNLNPDEDKGEPWYPRLQFHDFSLADMVHPEMGIVEGNAIRYRIALTNTIDLAKVPISPLETFWHGQFNDSTLRRSSFKYEWQQEEEEIHENLDLDAIRAEDWQATKNGRPFTYSTNVHAEEGIPLPEAGVNQKTELLLAEAYAVPDQECMGVLIFGGCWIKPYKGTAFYDFGEELVLDVLPATLDEFYDLAQEGEGWTLGWGGGAAQTFRALHDADGDGLSYAEDPDDSQFDKDNDGLSDGYELQVGSDPLLLDTDHDGLNDHEEAMLGTNPRVPDTDGDGLLDVEEHTGWKIVSGLAADGTTQYTWVWSDPLNVDPDRDGLTDFQERTYGYHPWLPSDPNVLVMSSELQEKVGATTTPFDGFVKPGAQLAYKATVENKLDSRQAQGLLSTDAPAVLDDQGVPPSSFVLQPLETKSIAGSVTVNQTNVSKAYSLTQVAGALISDLQAISSNAELWLRFDESANATVYADTSGRQPIHNGQCRGTGCSIAADMGRLGSAIRLAGTGYVHSDAPVSATDYGVALWFKADQDSPTGVLFTDISGSQYRAALLLSRGRLCGFEMGVAVCAPQLYTDKQWHHVVHTYGGRAEGQKLYVDGQLVASGLHHGYATTATTNANIGGSPYPLTDHDAFIGLIDDVRLFDFGLTAGDVETLLNQPVLHLDFDANNGWSDASPLQTPVTCVSLFCPSHSKEGVSGQSASFNGASFLSTGETPVLDLRTTPFSLAAWVYPISYGSGDARDSSPQGILGLRSGEADGAPSLERVGYQIRFGMGTDAGWKSWTSGNVLTERTWAHVAVTFEPPDNLVRLYVNGVLVGEDSQTFRGFTPASSTKRIDVGRSTNVARLSLGDGHTNKTGDGSNAFCGDAMHDELCMAIDGNEILNVSTLCGEDYRIRKVWTFTETATLKAWEDDKGTRCGAQKDDGDDTVYLKYNNTDNASESFNFMRPASGGDVQRDYKGGSYGYFHFTYLNDSIPFYGYLDEVEVYNWALDSVAIQKLANSTALDLNLDEPPGSATFQDVSMQGGQARCTDCPTSGVTGRINQAAWFERAKGNYLALANGNINRTTNNLTVAAWIKPHTLGASNGQILGTARTKSTNGFGFAVAGTNLLFSTYGVHDYLLTNVGLVADRWRHVAAVFDPANTVSFYIDGVFKTSLSYTAPAVQDTDDLLLVGAATPAGSSTLTDFFDGQIDDVRVYRRSLAATEIKAIYDMAPVLHLRFEESRGATRFADNALPDVSASCTGAQCPGTGEAVRGQIGLAADFDGYDDLVTVPDSDRLDLTKFTIGAWVFPTSTGLLDYSQELVSKYDANGISSNYDLGITANTLFPRISGTCIAGRSAASSVPLILNHWNQVVGTYDGKALRIYVNGAESGSVSASATPCANTGPVAIGGWVGKIQHSFAGRMDEVVVYRTALTAQQVRDMFTYQAGWVEDRQSFDLTVDADAPTVAIKVDDKSYVARQPVIVAVEADDATSGVVGVTLLTPDGPVTAARCMEAGGQAAWCPTISPSIEGYYALKATATDRVGSATASAIRTLIVDDSAPQVAIDGADLQRVAATASTAKPNAWTVHLTGTAADRPAGSAAGSGVPDDGVRIALLGADGAIVGGSAQVAVLAAGKWSLDYEVPNASPTGQYTVTAEAVDRVSRLPVLPAEQVARHTGAADVKRIVLDAAAPAVQLSRTGIAAGAIGPATPALAGAMTDRPAPVAVTWTTGDNGDKAGVTVTCAGPSASYTPYVAGAGTFVSAQTYTWEGNLQRGSTCHVQLSSTSDPTGVSGVIRVCGSQLATWDGNWTTSRDVAFTAEASACGPNLAVAGVNLGETAFTSVAPGSTLYNETPPAGEILHLPFDDQPDSIGNLSFRDISGGGHAGSCTGQTCPSTGQAGHAGTAVLFDGVNDVVSAGSQVALANTSFTVAFWAKRGATGRFETIVGQGSATTSKGLVLGYRANNKFTCAFWGNDLDTPAYTDTTWHHWTCTYDAATKSRTIYRDGAQVAQAAASANYQGSGNLYIGGFSSTAYPFTGLVDEVRIFSRALPAGEVRSLFAGAGPLVALDFEKAWPGDGAVLPDSSGWGHDGLLVAGANDAAGKSTPGAVGSNALRFDGVDDYVQVAADLGLDLSGGQFTEAAWIYSELADDNYHAILGYQPAASLIQRYPGLWVYQRNRIHAGFGDGTSWLNVTTGSVLASGWNHVAATFDGSAYVVYVNGSAVYTSTALAGHRPYATQQLQIGKVDSAFKGQIDDVRIYPRPLSAAELRSLYLSGWRQATLNQHGAGVEAANWTAAVPSGLEGLYQVGLRGTDVDGHTQAAGSRDEIWRGAADTLAPRVVLHRTAVDPSTFQYTVVAEDFNLAETDFTSPCGAGVIDARTYFVSPWYLAAVGEDTGHPSRLFRITASCSLPAGAVEQAKACDSAGNCATVGVTAATAEEVQAAGSPQAGPGVRLTPALSAAAGSMPAISFATTVLTSTNFYEPRTIVVSGLVTGTQALAEVQVSIGGATGTAALGETAATAPYTTTWRFPWRLPEDQPLPDGTDQVATATATDAAGRRATATATLTLDVVPPAPVTLALTADGSAVQPGATLRTSPADVALGWTASADGSGLAPYRIAWTSPHTQTASMASKQRDPALPREDQFAAGEAQRLSVALTSRDTVGNVRQQASEPIYVDGPRTPDYIALPASSDTLASPYEGWTESGCTLMGADRRAAALRVPQRLYTSWDAQALRLAWTGAFWGADSDLFIYLDTVPGGTDQVFTPAPVAVTGTVASLPAGLGADTLVWVQDAHTASLLRWDGSAWANAAPLSAAQYRFDATMGDAQTDLYLPFDLLGMTPGAPLGLLAFATEEPAPDVGLRLWATLPNVNPVNSLGSNRNAAFAGQGVHFTLSHFYHWAALADGVCPNGSDGSAGGGYADFDLRLKVTANPPAAAIAGRGGGLFWLPDPAQAAARLLSFMQYAYRPVNDGEEVLYTVNYRNAGTEMERGVWLALSAVGPLHLLDTTVALGDIAAGASGTATFRAVVDRSVSTQELAEIKAFVYDSSHDQDGAALDWLWAFHRVDRGAPDSMAITAPELAVGADSAALSGYAHDESGVTSVEVEIQAPSGLVSKLACPVPSPREGLWWCPWDIVASNGGVRPAHGETFSLRMAAIDSFGHRSDWTEPKFVWVDAQPPRLTLDLDASGVYTDAVVRGLGTLHGAAYDLSGTRSVRVCVDGGCGDAALQASHVFTTAWSYEAAGATPQDYIRRTIAVTGTDRVGNRMLDPLTLAVWVDNVPPVITVTTVISPAHAGAPVNVLSGTVSDGSPEVRVSIRSQGPNGELTRQAAGREGGAWWYDLNAAVPGLYTLWVDAEDMGGNRSSVGPFTVEATCLAAGLEVTQITAEPQGASSQLLTLSAQVSNSGPDALPAGMPVGFYAGSERAGVAVTSQALAAGESAVVTATWSAAGSGDYDVQVVPDDADGGVPSFAAAADAVPLCSTPETTHTVIAVRDVPIYSSWNLISAPVEPYVTDITVVQRPISGAYTAIFAYDQGLRTYRPDWPPDGNTLTIVDAGHGYWVQALAVPTPPLTTTVDEDPLATLRLAGRAVPEDQPLPLAAGWNLVGYLSHQTLPVADALQNIAGVYGAVLGFERTGLSYYPDLAPGFNTLSDMSPAGGYWIRASREATLRYPVSTVTATVTAAPGSEQGLSPAERVYQIRQAEQAAGVRPTSEWKNFYGDPALPDGSTVPTGTVVLALDPQGVVCGATVVAYPGQYGLLACYRDEASTSEDEGAVPGDAIRLVISSDGIHADGQEIGVGTWTAHGDRQLVPSQPVFLPLVMAANAEEYEVWLPLVMQP